MTDVPEGVMVPLDVDGRDPMSVFDWLEANVGEGQSRNEFRRRPKTYCINTPNLGTIEFIFAKKSDAMLFKLTWG